MVWIWVFIVSLIISMVCKMVILVVDDPDKLWLVLGAAAVYVAAHVAAIIAIGVMLCNILNR